MVTRIFLQFIAGVFLIALGFSSASAQQDLTVEFTNMSPHLNQNIHLRIVDKSTMKETGRTSMMISSADFNVILPAVEAGGSYFADFYADHNGNGQYDAPPADHAWRLSLDNATGSDTLTFSHNTSFTDIKWPYMLTMNFANMTPHVGQLLEIKLENSTIEKEIDRVKITSVESAAFAVPLVGLSEPGDYSIEFYADLNGNGLYDAPPVDHAWKISLDYTGGDEEVTFTHNTEFTDVKWDYLATVNFISMTPHVGQLLELRITDSDNTEEVGRFSLPAVLVPDFTISIPGFHLDENYKIDFYADLNGNGMYDAPPADHAWRINFNSSTGDFTTDFTHNTSFTDIQWTAPTSVKDETTQPVEFALDQNYPNPFNPATSISYQLPAENFVTLRIYDAIGKEVATLINENKNAGYYEINWNASTLPSGVYFYRLEAGSFSAVKKLVLMK